MKRIGTPQRADSVRPKAAHREIVLYVEDDDDNWTVASLRLGQAYELIRAANADEAYRLLQQHGSNLSAILMDIELRGSELNGVELTRLIRGKLAPTSGRFAAPLSAAARTVPIIFVTAHGAKYSDAELHQAGAEKVIAKPVDFSALSLALTQFHLARAARGRKL
jgi:CheY-like chemotaxis protein